MTTSQQDNQAQPPASDPGTRMLDRVWAAYTAAMTPIETQTYVAEFVRIAMGDEAATQDLTLEVLGKRLITHPQHGQRIGQIKLYDLAMELASRLLEKQGLLPKPGASVAAATPAPEPTTSKAKASPKAGPKAKAGAKEPKEPKAPKAGKKPKAEKKGPAPAPASRKTNPPPEFTATAAAIVAAVKKAGTDGLKIQAIAEESGYDKESCGKIVRKLVEDKKLAKREGTAGPGTHYIAA